MKNKVETAFSDEEMAEIEAAAWDEDLNVNQWLHEAALAYLESRRAEDAIERGLAVEGDGADESDNALV